MIPPNAVLERPAAGACLSVEDAPKEKIKIVICVPTSGMVRASFSYSLTGLVCAAASGMLPKKYELVQLQLDVQVSSVIHGNREKLCMDALDKGATHVLFLDDDMQFEPKVLAMLLAHDKPIVAVNYAMKKMPIDFVAVSLDGKSRVITDEQSTGLVEVAYTGFGVSLIKTEVFRKTPQPWFLPEWVPDQKCYTTEDNPFFRRARENGFPCLIDQDASKLVRHVGGETGFSWEHWRPQPDQKVMKTEQKTEA